MINFANYNLKSCIDFANKRLLASAINFSFSALDISAHSSYEFIQDANLQSLFTLFLTFSLFEQLIMIIFNLYLYFKFYTSTIANNHNQNKNETKKQETKKQKKTQKQMYTSN